MTGEDSRTRLVEVIDPAPNGEGTTVHGPPADQQSNDVTHDAKTTKPGARTRPGGRSDAHRFGWLTMGEGGSGMRQVLGFMRGESSPQVDRRPRTGSARDRRTMFQRFGVLAIVLSLVLGVPTAMAQEGGSPYTSIDPATPAGEDIQSLYKLIFWMAVVVFVFVQFLIVYASLRFRRRRSHTQRPAQIHGNKTLEIAWTIIPAIILLIIAIPTITLIYDFAAEAEEGELVVDVYGKQWWWEIHYPDYIVGENNDGDPISLVTANEIRVPVNTKIQFNLHSNNVIHAFWIPRFGGKMDVIPGHQNQLAFTPTEVGTFYGECTEFCGTAHSWMRFVVKVQPQEEFDAWVDAYQAGPSSATAAYAPEGDVAQVPQAFGLCVLCHNVYGTNASNAQSGIATDPTSVGAAPNLTLFGCRDTIAAGVLENTPENLALWLDRPEDVKAGNFMANAEGGVAINNDTLSEEQIAVLVPYLQSLVPEGGCPEEGLGDTYNDGSSAEDAGPVPAIVQEATPAAGTPTAGTPNAGTPVAATPAADGGVEPAGDAVLLEGGDIFWEQTELTVPVGGTIELVNIGAAQHNFAIEGYNDDAPVDMPIGGEPVLWDVPDDLAPGTYTFYCAIPGHRAAGMVGTITITE